VLSGCCSCRAEPVCLLVRSMLLTVAVDGASKDTQCALISFSLEGCECMCACACSCGGRQAAPLCDLAQFDPPPLSSSQVWHELLGY
jgi:hypothetical protein